MDDVTKIITYLQSHPLYVVGAVVAFIGVFFLLNRKPRAVRDADARLEQLRKERQDYYRQRRPMK